MPVATNFLDTNILIYSVTSDLRAAKAHELLALPFATSVQALSEFANVAHKKLRMPWAAIVEALEAIISSAQSVLPMNEKTTFAAIELAQRYNFSFYDATMVAAAVSAGCTNYISEDLHDGLVIKRQMTIINPFR